MSHNKSMAVGDDLRRAISEKRAQQATRDATEVRPPSHVRLGPLTLTVLERSRWQGTDAFPSSQLFADEVERVLNFALANDEFGKYLGLLAGTASQRDAALAELRVAFYFHRNGLQISGWRPVGANNREGEYLLRGPSGVDVFAEVKGPGWESELSDEEKVRGRQREKKYLYCEPRSLRPHEAIGRSIQKAYGKFAPKTSNLLVIVDDLFAGLGEAPEAYAQRALYDAGGYFTTPDYQNLGGVGIFWVVFNDSEVWYEMRLFLNPHAGPCSLPEDIAKGFHGYVPPPVEEPSRIVVVSH